MEAPQQHIVKREDEISLKFLIVKIRQWTGYLLRKWYIIVLFAFTGGGLGLLAAAFAKTKYTASLTFVLEDSKSGGGLGSYAGIASQLGIDLPGGGSSIGVFAGDNILEFLKSRLMVERTLLSPVTVNNSKMSFADLYIDINQFRQRWSKFPALQSVHFPLTQDRATYTILQDSVLNVLYDQITKKELEVEKPDKGMSFIDVSCVSSNEIFAKGFTEQLVKEATEFYIATKTKRSKVSVDYLQNKADSLLALLNQKTYAAASQQDLNLNPVRKVASVNVEVATRDKQIIQTMYAEVVKNLELSRVTMAQQTPLIQVIDAPILPLEKKKLGKLKGLVIGIFVGGFLGVGLLAARRVYKNVMSE